MDALDIQMADVDLAYRRYTDALETSRFYDSLEKVYDTWDKHWKEYWGRFSKAYAEGSEFYSEDFPVDCFWGLMTLSTIAWYNSVMIDEID